LHLWPKSVNRIMYPSKSDRPKWNPPNLKPVKTDTLNGRKWVWFFDFQAWVLLFHPNSLWVRVWVRVTKSGASLGSVKLVLVDTRCHP
jgi:hypothetical protein